MKDNKIHLILILLIFLASCASGKKSAVTDSSVAALSGQGTGATLWFQHSAEMRAAFYQAYNYGRMLVDKKLALNSYENPAVVFDIDETLLDNSPYQAWLIHNNALFGEESWMEWTRQVRAAALPGALEFIAYLRSKGIAIYYISNRMEKERKPTMENLRQLGFPEVTQDHVLLKESTSDKTSRRQQVRRTNTVILFVGDNLNDFNQLFDGRGGDYGKGLVDQYRDDLLNNFVIIPNPMYGEWEQALLENKRGLDAADQIMRRKKSLVR